MFPNPISRPKNSPAVMVLIWLLGLVTLSGCGNKARISGLVLDGFGAPLPEATVSIEGTTFKAITERKGKYAVGYVPGKIKLSVSKDGYLPVDLTFDIATESEFPAQSVTLYKTPPAQGVWLFGKSDYVRLNTGKISFKSKEFPFSWKEALYEEKYTALGEFTAVEYSAGLRFLDNYPSPISLVRLREADVILFRTKYWKRSEDKFDQIVERRNNSAKGYVIREVSLDRGRYAFVIINQSSKSVGGAIRSGGPAFGFAGHPIGEPVYIFDVK